MNYRCSFLNNLNGIIFTGTDITLSQEYLLKFGCSDSFLNDFFSQETLKIVGLANYETTLKFKTYISNEFSVPKKELVEEDVLNYLLYTCAIFCNSLWLIKDNSVRFNIGHLKYTDGITLTVHSNFINSIYTNSISEKNITNFSTQEIEDAIKYFSILFKITLGAKGNNDTHAEVDRIRRSFYFIDLARKNFDIGTKVSLHCSAFECLFSVSTTELRHRLSETIANFLGIDLKSRKSLYNDVKMIYDLRSSVTHGAGISKKLIKDNSEELKKIGNVCDDIMRRCILKIIDDPELNNMYLENNNDKITEYLSDLNFV